MKQNIADFIIPSNTIHTKKALLKRLSYSSTAKIAIPKLLQILESTFKMHAVIGYELEFYVDNEYIIDKMQNLLLPREYIESLVEEEGINQFEIKFAKSSNTITQLTEIYKTKHLMQSIALDHGSKIFFDAKPFCDQPGSSMHMHLNFINDKGGNLFAKNGNCESQSLLYSVGGLLDTMQESIQIFAQSKESISRFECSRDMNTPKHVSWGGNNRTTAIRIPAEDKTLPYNNRRIEHRVACADADITSVTAAILFGVYHGLLNKIMPVDKIFGNAFDEQYSDKITPFRFV